MGSPDVRKAATITDAGLNAAFQEGFEEGRDVTDRSQWKVRVEFRFEGKAVNIRHYDYESGLAKVLVDVSQHLANGPDTSVEIAVYIETKALEGTQSGDTDEDPEIVDAEVVSDTADD